MLTICSFVAYGLVNGAANQVLIASPALIWFADAIFYTFIPLACLAHLYVKFRLKPADYGLRAPTAIGNFLGTTLVLLLLLFFTYECALGVSRVLLHVSGLSDLATPSFQFMKVLPGWPMRFPAATYLSVSAGLLESIMFIGLPWVLWRQRFGRTRNGLFVLFTSTLFAAAHWEQGAPGIAGALAFGLVACSMYLKIADLWPVVGAHTVIDLVIFW